VGLQGGSSDLLGVTLFLDRLEGGSRSVRSQWESSHGNTALPSGFGLAAIEDLNEGQVEGIVERIGTVSARQFS
jgi:hypothetical protein